MSKEFSSTDKSIQYCILLQYNGLNFCGSQRQKNERTVQGILEQSLTILLKNDSVTVVLSGRTDSGVSSEGTIALFTHTHEIDMPSFMTSINALLPNDLSVLAIDKVSSKFHSVKSALYKWYRYTILNASHNHVFNTPKLIFKKPLNLEAISEALELIKGEHNFKGFSSVKTSTKYHVCKIIYSSCHKNGFDIYIDIVGNRFLYNMIRIIVGTLIKIGTGDLPVNSIQEILSQQKREMAGPTVRACGLTLKWIFYPEYFNIFTQIKNNVLDEYSTIKKLIEMELKANENICCKA